MTTQPATNAARPKILLDCDPGVDDMFAIFTATRYCDLVAITSVAGNVGIEHTTKNALGVAQLSGVDIPVHRGASAPLTGAEPEDAAHVHGANGLGGVELPLLQNDVASNDAVGALFDLTSSGDVTVVAVGPLTNIALAIQRDPSWIKRIPRLVIMGGSSTTGNVTPYAEFNIYADPEAAEVVFNSGIELTMVGLNLTRQVSMGADEIEMMRAANSQSASFAADALEFYASFSLSEYGVAKQAMHDPCAVLEVVRPDLFGRQAMHVVVETAGIHTRGMTVCDLRENAQSPNTDVLVSADGQLAVRLIVDAAIHPSDFSVV